MGVDVGDSTTDGAALESTFHPGSLETVEIELPEPTKRPRPELLHG